MMEQTEVVVIGSGIGGLCCTALLARYGYDVVVCESHSLAGGAAHGFERGGFLFDSGPSLYSGLSYRPSPNPLRQVLDAIGEDASWLNYDTWGCLPEGDFDTTVGAEQFCQVLDHLQGMFPGPQTPIKHLWCCGDSTFPGIGLPAVAASGMMLANTLAPVAKHMTMLREIGVLKS